MKEINRSHFHIFPKYPKCQEFIYTICTYAQAPTSIYCWLLKPLSVLHSRFPTKKSWVVAYFWPQHFFKIFFVFLSCNSLVQMLQCKKSFKKNVDHQNMKKLPQNVAYFSRNSEFRNFSLTSQQPKWQKLSCPYIWPIDQLYI